MENKESKEKLSEEETLRRLLVELRLLEGTAETLRSRINLVNAAITELSFANMTLEGLEKESRDTRLFVPIGGGSYVKAKLESPDTVIVGMGANVAVERTMKEAREFLEARLDELEKTRTTLHRQFTQVIDKIREDREQLEIMSRKLRAEGRQPSSVRETKSGA